MPSLPPEPGCGETPPPPAAGCCSFLKNAKGFELCPPPFPHRPGGQDLGFNCPGRISWGAGKETTLRRGAWVTGELAAEAPGGTLPSSFVRAEKELAPGRLPVGLSNNKRCLSVSQGLVCLFTGGGHRRSRRGIFVVPVAAPTFAPRRRGRAGAKPRGAAAHRGPPRTPTRQGGEQLEFIYLFIFAWGFAPCTCL